jgi:hypothetical protein
MIETVENLPPHLAVIQEAFFKSSERGFPSAWHSIFAAVNPENLDLYRTLKERLARVEARSAALTEQLQTANNRADTNLGELNRISQENIRLTEQVRVLEQPFTDADVQAVIPGAAWPEEVHKAKIRLNARIASRSAAGKEGEDVK